MYNRMNCLVVLFLNKNKAIPLIEREDYVAGRSTERFMIFHNDKFISSFGNINCVPLFVMNCSHCFQFNCDFQLLIKFSVSTMNGIRCTNQMTKCLTAVDICSIHLWF